MFVVQCIIFCVCKLLVGFSFLCLPYYTQVKIQLLRKQKSSPTVEDRRNLF